ncbi:hypothetical protein B0T25DRAFT_569868 [Lasiosphaeria hispida]|uniref:Uncharacterized protein n=1 Tax=Lasiosphaeria hispida TaxID=260671 RepID=A0AAJ0MC33_9PEZI|nr:hypothetical protein B0T25DRAFT_569868 [Lasiosphaeria hispida]
MTLTVNTSPSSPSSSTCPAAAAGTRRMWGAGFVLRGVYGAYMVLTLLYLEAQSANKSRELENGGRQEREAIEAN